MKKALNEIDAEAAGYLAKGLINNSTLKTLILRIVI